MNCTTTNATTPRAQQPAPALTQQSGAGCRVGASRSLVRLSRLTLRAVLRRAQHGVTAAWRDANLAGDSHSAAEHNLSDTTLAQRLGLVRHNSSDTTCTSNWRRDSCFTAWRDTARTARPQHGVAQCGQTCPTRPGATRLGSRDMTRMAQHDSSDTT
jgi:hypothetical protein